MKISILYSGAALLLLSSMALAQPDAANGAKAQNPANLNMGGPGGGGPGGRNNLTALQREQLAAQTAQIRELNQRQTLTLAGITDVKVQDAVLVFLNEQESARQGLQQKWFQLIQSLRGAEVNDTQIVTRLNSFRDAIDDEKARREKALAALDEKIGFTKNPRLDAMLMVAGVTGDEASLMNSVTMNNMGGRGNNMMGGNPGGGGPGGGNGGPGGGGFGGNGGFGGGPGGGGPGGFGGGPGGPPGGGGPGMGG